MSAESRVFGMAAQLYRTVWVWNSALDLAGLSIRFWVVAPIALFHALEAWLAWRGVWRAHALARAALALAAFSLSCLALVIALDAAVGLGVLLAVVGSAGLCHASFAQLGHELVGGSAPNGGVFARLLTAADPKLKELRARRLTRRFGRAR